MVPLWMQLVTFALALAGLGVSIYLTIAHFTESTLLGCSEKAGLVNCTKVTTSAQSYVFGIPVAVLGLAFFVAAVALMSPWAWQAPRYRREIYLIRLASLVVAIGFVLYLLYAELFIIGSICLYCTSVHVITFLLFGLTVFAAAAWGIPERQRGLGHAEDALVTRWMTLQVITSSSCSRAAGSGRGRRTTLKAHWAWPHDERSGFPCRA